jgi:tRNA(adenine34) deaminase
MRSVGSLAGGSVDGDERFMRLAIEEAEAARREGEVPVGAIVVLDQRVVGRGRNAPIGSTDPTAHAEIVALRDAARRVGNYRLTGAVLYCTVEPCLMCLGASLIARVGRVVWAASDPKIGAARHLEAMRASGAMFNHRFETRGGVLAEEAAGMLKSFFRDRRDAGETASSSGEPQNGTERECGEVAKWS